MGCIVLFVTGRSLALIEQRVDSAVGWKEGKAMQQGQEGFGAAFVAIYTEGDKVKNSDNWLSEKLAFFLDKGIDFMR